MLKAIEALECTPEFTQLKIELSAYKDVSGKENPEYLVTRDGFSFFAMGFTGKTAATWLRGFFVQMAGIAAVSQFSVSGTAIMLISLILALCAINGGNEFIVRQRFVITVGVPFR